MARSLLLDHIRIKAVEKGIERAHVGEGTQQRVRTPFTWEMLTYMEEAAGGLGVSGRIAWIR